MSFLKSIIQNRMWFRFRCLIDQQVVQTQKVNTNILLKPAYEVDIKRCCYILQVLTRSGQLQLLQSLKTLWRPSWDQVMWGSQSPSCMPHALHLPQCRT